jgi:metal-responsive CopG/Arc/MetJ family transcriptional regulator
MKTAISLPDDLFASAEVLAERLGLSRSRLFATAVAEFVAKHQTRKVTERLDAVYRAEASTLDPALRRSQRRRLPKDNW